jgi:signal transduction histidine kinase
MKASNIYEGESSRFSALHFLSDLFSDSKKPKTLKDTANIPKEQSFGNDNISTPKPSEFLTAIVHELKTPLNAIIGLSDVMSDSDHYQLTAQEIAEYARDINVAAMELNELIHDILDVEQAASGNFSVDGCQKVRI